MISSLSSELVNCSCLLTVNNIPCAPFFRYYMSFDTHINTLLTKIKLQIDFLYRNKLPWTHSAKHLLKIRCPGLHFVTTTVKVSSTSYLSEKHKSNAIKKHERHRTNVIAINWFFFNMLDDCEYCSRRVPVPDHRSVMHLKGLAGAQRSRAMSKTPWGRPSMAEGYCLTT